MINNVNLLSYSFVLFGYYISDSFLCKKKTKIVYDELWELEN